MPLKRGETFKDRYLIRRKIGGGRYGIVFEAEDRKMGRTVAIKEIQIRGASDEEEKSLFEKAKREVRAQAAVRHPNILEIHDVNEDEENLELHLIMEFAEKGNLARLIAEHGKRTPQISLWFIREILSGLDAIHRAGYVHGDIKPENILLREGSCKIGDFGLAKAAEGSKSVYAEGKGTPEYMAPECWDPKAKMDFSADVYSAGCVLYFLLSGRPPFTGTMEQVMAQHREAAPARVEGVPVGLWKVIERSMAKKKEDRYQNAGKMRKALAECVRAKEKVYVCKRCGRLPDGRDFNAGRHETIGRIVCERCEGAHPSVSPERGENREPPLASTPRIMIPGPEKTTERMINHRYANLGNQMLSRAKKIQKESWMLETRVNELGRPEARWGEGEYDWLVSIPAGEFMMGAVPQDKEAFDHEKSRHKVRITKQFWIMKYPVTQEQYERIMVENPSHYKWDEKRPVECVSWNDAQAFITQLHRKTGLRFRLPTEAEWEYACRAGTETIYYWGDRMNGDYAWYKDNSGDTTHQVGKKKPNGFGLYDMLGNVWEWVSDWYGEKYYSSSTTEDPKGHGSGQYRVLRGGSWDNGARFMRVSNRAGRGPGNGDSRESFRCAQDAASGDGSIESLLDLAETEVDLESLLDIEGKESLSEIFERRQIKYMLGKRVSRDIEADDGTKIIKGGEIINKGTIAKAKNAGKFLELSMNIEIEE